MDLNQIGGLFLQVFRPRIILEVRKHIAKGSKRGSKHHYNKIYRLAMIPSPTRTTPNHYQHISFIWLRVLLPIVIQIELFKVDPIFNKFNYKMRAKVAPKLCINS